MGPKRARWRDAPEPLRSTLYADLVIVAIWIASLFTIGLSRWLTAFPAIALVVLGLEIACDRNGSAEFIASLNRSSRRAARLVGGQSLVLGVVMLAVVARWPIS